MTASLLFVGESPPGGASPDFVPFDCQSGTRLASLIGLRDRATLLRCVRLANLYGEPTGIPNTPPWSPEWARMLAKNLTYIDGHSDETRRCTSIVALGRRVADAFDVPCVDSKSRTPAPPLLTAWRHDLGPLVTYAPRPSEASTVLNTPEVRQAVRFALVQELVLGCPALRPWDFNLDDVQVLAALAVAVSPRAPAVGAAAMRWAAAQRDGWQAITSTPLLARVAAQGEPPPRPEWSQGWDCPLRQVLDVLANEHGARNLAAGWAPHAAVPIRNAGDKWLLRAAEGLTTVTDAIPLHVVRAAGLRYEMEATR